VDKGKLCLPSKSYMFIREILLVFINLFLSTVIYIQLKLKQKGQMYIIYKQKYLYGKNNTNKINWQKDKLSYNWAILTEII